MYAKKCLKKCWIWQFIYLCTIWFSKQIFLDFSTLYSNWTANIRMGKRVLLTSPLCRVVGGKVGGPFPTHSFNPLHRLSFASSLDVTTLTVTARRVFTFYLRNYTRANRICVPTNPESEVRLQVVGHIFPPPTDQTPAMVSQCSMPFSTFCIFSISLADPAAYKLKSFLGITRQDLPSASRIPFWRWVYSDLVYLGHAFQLFVFWHMPSLFHKIFRTIVSITLSQLLSLTIF